MPTLKELRERFSKPRARPEPEVDEWNPSGESKFSRDTIGKLQEAFENIFTTASRAAESIYDTVDAVSERLISSSSVIYRSTFPDMIEKDKIDDYFHKWIAMGFEIMRDVRGSDYIDVVIRDDGKVAVMAGYKCTGDNWIIARAAGLEALLRKMDGKAKGHSAMSITKTEAAKELEDWYCGKKGDVVPSGTIRKDSLPPFSISVDDEEIGKFEKIGTINPPEDEDTHALVEGTTPSGIPFKFKTPSPEEVRKILEGREAAEEKRVIFEEMQPLAIKSAKGCAERAFDKEDLICDECKFRKTCMGILGIKE